MTSPGATVETHAHVPEDLYSSWSPSLSPDGQRVAFVSDRGGHPEVWMRALHGGPLTAVDLGGRRVTAVTWSPTGEWLACLVAPPGRSGHEAWVVRPDGSGARLVGGRAPGTALLAGGRSRGWTDDGRVVVTETVADADAQVVVVEPGTGARTLVHEGPLIAAVDVTADGRTLLVRRGPRGRRELLAVSADGEQPVLPAARADGDSSAGPGSTEAGCLAPDGSVAYVRSDARAERAELIAGDLVVGHPGRELEEVALSGDGGVVALTWNVDGGASAVTLLDVATGDEREIAPLPRQVVHGCSLSHDGRVLVLTAEGPTDAQGVWFDAGSGFTALSSPGRGPLRASVGASAPAIDPAEVVAPALHRLGSPDGTALSGWLYRPPGAGPWPTMIWLHGGPEAQERPVYSSLFQSLVAADLAVFAPNVRGSTGFGRTFRSADDGPGRYGAFADVVACATHLLDAAIAVPGRLGISGRSYGGYLTLAMLTRAPELFAVGVAVSGMSDLLTWYATTEPWIGAAAVGKYGDPVRDRDLLADLSPLADLHRVAAPVLLVHGADDTNVPATESEQAAAVLQERGLPHRLLLFPGEGHELLDTANRVAFVQATRDWILDHL